VLSYEPPSAARIAEERLERYRVEFEVLLIEARQVALSLCRRDSPPIEWDPAFETVRNQLDEVRFRLRQSLPGDAAAEDLAREIDCVLDQPPDFVAPFTSAPTFLPPAGGLARADQVARRQPAADHGARAGARR
jgi:hypothetical protein